MRLDSSLYAPALTADDAATQAPSHGRIVMDDDSFFGDPLLWLLVLLLVWAGIIHFALGVKVKVGGR